MSDILSTRTFKFSAPQREECDVLVIAGEHSGDEQASRMIASALKKNPDLRVCAFGGENLAKAGAQLLFDMTSFSVVGIFEVIKNYGFFKKLSEAVADWICRYKPKKVCFVDYPGFNLHLAKMLKERGVSVKGGGDIKLFYYISPQIWAWKAGRRFKMAEVLDSLATIFPFEPNCYADTSLPVKFVGHPFLEEAYNPPVEYNKDGEILLLSGSRTIAVSRIFPIMVNALRYLPNERGVVIYPTQAIKNEIDAMLAKNQDVAKRIRVMPNGSEKISVKGAMMSSGTMSLSCSLEGIPGAIVYKANPFTYFLGRAFVNIQYLSIANIILDKPAWREFIQFDASPEKIAKYMQECLTADARKTFCEYADTLKNILRAPAEQGVADWLLND
ncbi:MAG: lipid-A-disaccharide synthase [Opitutales bacterium]|nr:lipid-A-disaccharide synthase [Opitutales bacterium]